MSKFDFNYLLIIQGMSDLPDFKKISFPDMPPIPLEVIVPDAPTEVNLAKHTLKTTCCIDCYCMTCRLSIFSVNF